MSANIITNLQLPVLQSSEGNKVVFQANWLNLYDGGEEFKNMDVVWFINGEQYESHFGQGVIDSDTLEIERSDYGYLFRNRGKVNTVQYKVRGVYEGAGRWTNFAESWPRVFQVPYNPVPSIKYEDDKITCSLKKNSRTGEDSYQRDEYSLHAKLTGIASNGQGRIDYNWQFGIGDSLDDYVIEGDQLRNIMSYVRNNDNVTYTLTLEAWSSNMTGESGHPVERFVIARPNRPEIVQVSHFNQSAFDNAGVLANSDVYVLAKTNANASHPIDKVYLERLKGTEASTATLAALQEWPTPVKQESYNCTSFRDALQDALPTERERYTWYRVKTERCGFTSISVPVLLPGSYRPGMSVVNGAAYIYGVMSGDTGTSVKTDIIWSADKFKNDDGESANYESKTQVAWSDDEHAWESTEQPKTFDLTWDNKNQSVINSYNNKKPQGYTDAFVNNASVFVSGLTEGKPVFVKARRFSQKKGSSGSSDAQYGAWSNMVSCIPVSKPAWVNLQAPTVIARGESIPLVWTLGTDAAQTGWTITDANGRGYANGDDANGYYVMPPESYGKATSLKIRCSATTGGLWCDSNYVEIAIKDAPVCTVGVADELAELPLVINASCNKMANIVVAIVSRGVKYTMPDGTRTQYSGDIIWSSDYRADTASGMRVFDANLIDGCTYDVICYATDEYGLRSEQVVDSFTVDWTNKAALPSATVDVDQIGLLARIHVEAGDGSDSSDTCSVYRVTSDGAYLIADKVAFGSTVTDRFAPYSAMNRGVNHCYRVATVTTDGSIAWRDVAYDMRGGGVRLDWDDKSLSLPFNNKFSESIEKLFEARTHLDGTTDGYWDEGFVRTASVTTDLIKVESFEERRLVREVATYAGGVLLRTSSGLCFEADVQISEIEESDDSSAVAVSLSITEIKLSDAFKCRAGDVVKDD